MCFNHSCFPSTKNSLLQQDSGVPGALVNNYSFVKSRSGEEFLFENAIGQLGNGKATRRNLSNQDFCSISSMQLLILS